VTSVRVTCRVCDISLQSDLEHTLSQLVVDDDDDDVEDDGDDAERHVHSVPIVCGCWTRFCRDYLVYS